MGKGHSQTAWRNDASAGQSTAGRNRTVRLDLLSGNHHRSWGVRQPACRTLLGAPSASPEPGTEYGNAIRDLLDLDIDVASLLPADDESDGFDNIADVLKVSPSLLEQYLTASEKVSSLAVGDPAITPISRLVQVPPDLPQEDHIEGLPLGTRGGILIHHNLPLSTPSMTLASRFCKT